MTQAKVSVQFQLEGADGLSAQTTAMLVESSGGAADLNGAELVFQSLSSAQVDALMNHPVQSVLFHEWNNEYVAQTMPVAAVQSRQQVGATVKMVVLGTQENRALLSTPLPPLTRDEVTRFASAVVNAWHQP